MNGGWTRHGHAIAGMKQTGKQPALVARCGGPAMCRQCALDAGTFRHEGAWLGEDEVAELQAMAPPEAVGIEFHSDGTAGWRIATVVEFTLATAIAAEGGRCGIVTCKTCGAALLIDPRDRLDVERMHTEWHERIDGRA